MPDIISFALLPGLGLTMLVFGFAPRFLLRLILLMYPRDAARRAELMAELAARPWRERPVWIAEQFETGLMDGLPQRYRQRRLRRQRRHQARQVSDSARADDGVEVIKLPETPTKSQYRAWIMVQKAKVTPSVKSVTLSVDAGKVITFQAKWRHHDET